jgi:predicted outer membrane protein
MKLRTLVIGAALAGGLVADGANAQTTQPVANGKPQSAAARANPLPPAEMSVLTTLTRLNQLQLAATTLAVQRAVSEDVREFAEQVLQGNAALGTKLRNVAQKTQVALPAPPPYGPLPPEHARALQELAEAEGTDFDRKFLAMQSSVNRTARQELETALGDTHNGYVSEFGYDTTTVLRYYAQKSDKLQVYLGLYIGAPPQLPSPTWSPVGY